MDTQIKHRLEMVDMCCKLLGKHGGVFTDKFKTSCTIQLRELIHVVNQDLLKYDPNLDPYWEILEAIKKAKPHLEYRP